MAHEDDPAPLSPDVLSLRDQVAANSHRSDARFAGCFSLCGLFLRLYDQYQWEKGLCPWDETNPADVHAWIDERERLWSGLDEDPRPLSWRGRSIDPFDAEDLNRDLADQGLFYGSGLAAFLKPTFFLSTIRAKRDVLGCTVLYLGNDLARDLFTVPAMTRDRLILARRRPLSAWLWDTLQNVGGSRSRAIEDGFAAYDLSRDDLRRPHAFWRDRWEGMLDAEMDAYVWHELGEIHDAVFPEEAFRSLVANQTPGRMELMARTIKDLLADTGPVSRLGFIVKERRRGSLALYRAGHDGLAARLFPEMAPAYDRFVESGDWDRIDQARDQVFVRTRDQAVRLMDLAETFKDRPDNLAEAVNQSFYQPLGL
jgi:hypothetical protein